MLPNTVNDTESYLISDESSGSIPSNILQHITGRSAESGSMTSRGSQSQKNGEFEGQHDESMVGQPLLNQ